MHHQLKVDKREHQTIFSLTTKFAISSKADFQPNHGINCDKQNSSDQTNRFSEPTQSDF